MNALILPGNSLRHREWGKDLAVAVTPLFGTVHMHEYRHWDTGEPEADTDYELEQLQKLTALGGYVIIAKSIGTVIAAIGIERGVLTPTHCLFMGIPLNVVDQLKLDFADMMKNLPSTVIQNTSDPYGSFADVSTQLMSPTNAGSFSLIENPGDTHDYLDFDQIKQLISVIDQNKAPIS